MPNEVTPTMVSWSGMNSGPPESPKQLPSPPPTMPMPEVLSNWSPTALLVVRSLTMPL